MVHIQSVCDPFNSPDVARAAVTTLTRAEAMGLLPQGEVIDALDLPTLHKVVKGISRAGIGQSFLSDFAGTADVIRNIFQQPSDVLMRRSMLLLFRHVNGPDW